MNPSIKSDWSLARKWKLLLARFIPLFWRILPSRKLRGFKRHNVSIEGKLLSIDDGKSLYLHIHRPLKEGMLPCVVLVPGAEEAGTSFDRGWFRADDIARAGIVAIHFDPEGRGKSDGEEDHWGIRHQENLFKVLGYIDSLSYVDKDSIGVLSFSIGIIIASGALARYRDNIRVKYLMDWEGPSNRYNTTKNDTHEPLKRFPTSDNIFWDKREASKYIGNIDCAYLRFQGEIDHVQGYYKGHAVELINNALKGGVPWVRCNDNSPNILYNRTLQKRYHWISPWTDHMAILLKYLVELANKNSFERGTE